MSWCEHCQMNVNKIYGHRPGCPDQDEEEEEQPEDEDEVEEDELQ